MMTRSVPGLPHLLPRKLQNALPAAQAAVFQNPFVRQIDDEAGRNGVQEKDPEIIRIVLKQWVLRLQIDITLYIYIHIYIYNYSYI